MYFCAELQKGDRQSLFGGGVHYILEAEIVLGMIYRQGGIPKRGVLQLPPN